MFDLRKRAKTVYADEWIIDSFIQILVYRGEIIPNRVFMDKERELNGIVGFSGQKLSDELDAVAVYYVYKIFIENGRTVNELDQLLLRTYRQFVKDKVIPNSEYQKLYNVLRSRVHEYLTLRNHKYVGASFMAHVVAGHNALANDTGRYVAPVLKTLQSNIEKIIKTKVSL